MGNTDTKIQYRKAVIQLTTQNQSLDINDPSFWSQFWSDQISCIQDIYTLIPASEIRALREEAPANLATLCYKTVERLIKCIDNACITQKDQIEALNCVRLLTRILPYIFEEPEWRGFFWSSAPIKKIKSDYSDTKEDTNKQSAPLAQLLLNALTDLLFMPDFTASTCRKGPVENPDDIHNIDSCEYIWEAGVGFAYRTPHSPQFDQVRVEIVKLLLTTFSETMYMNPTNDLNKNKWIEYFTSAENRHTLPLFTSLINVVFSYDPIGYGLPYNYIIWNDSREPLVECVLQVLCVTLEQNSNIDEIGFYNNDSLNYTVDDFTHNSNLFINYLTRIHRDEDFAFILKGFSRLLNNPLIQTYLPGSAKKVSFHQELFILFWKFCDLNKRFLYFALKSSEVLDILVPILYYLVDSRADTSKIGLMHIGVFILLLLSGERNFGVRLNKPYTSRIPMDIPVFTGTYADLLVIVFHKIITTSHQRLQPLYDCLLTIIVNISPYFKSLSMVTCNKLLHLLEAFTTPSFLFANSTNHHLVFFLLEVFNNIIQYQFDGNANLMYTVIRKRVLFFNLLNLSIDQASIDKALVKQQAKKNLTANNNNNNNHVNNTESVNKSLNIAENYKSMDGSMPAKEAEPGTLKTTLAATPSVLKMTEKTTPTTINQTFDANANEEIVFNDEWKAAHETAQTIITQAPKPIDINFTTTTQNAFKSEPSLPPAATINLSPAKSETSKSLTSKKLKHHNGSTSSRDTTINTITTPINSEWKATTEWAQAWKHKLPLQTIMRLLQILVPQVEKICIDKGLTDESEILKFLQHGTLVGLLPVPHPILIRKYQPNFSTNMWFKTYIWGVIYLRNSNPPIFYDTDVKLFEIQRV